MQVRPRHSTGGANQSNDLPATHRVSHGYQWLAHVKIRGNHAAAVIDVHDVSREKKVVDECDDAAIRCTDRLTHCAAKVHA
jgi:hypothetical protein